MLTAPNLKNLLLLISNLIQFQHEEEISEACIDD